MRYINRLGLVLLLALALGVGAARGASAQGSNPWGVEPPERSGDGVRAQGTGGTVEKTFELTLAGDVPEGEVAFALYVSDDPNNLEGEVLFCGPAEFDFEQPCAADTFTSDPITFAAGTTVDFIFLGGTPTNEGPTFVEEGMETLTEDTVNEAVFDYGGDDQQGGDDDQQDDDGAGDDVDDGDGDGDSLPDTGGAMPAGLPLSGVPAALGLGAAAFAVLRRR